MKHTIIASALALGAMSGGAMAEGLSYGVDAALGGLWNRNGGSGVEPACGVCAADERLTGKLGLSVANDFGGFIGQVDIGFQHISRFTPVGYPDDGTNHTADIALRLMTDIGSVRAGLFLGYGEQDDYGDSDKNMTYSFSGIDASMETGFGAVFGQIGRLDSTDEYNEGPSDGTFVRVGAEFNLGKDLLLSAAISTHDGVKGTANNELRTNGLELGLEKALGDSGMSVYGSFEYTEMSFRFKDVDYGDTFGTVWVGLKIDLGGTRSNARKLPNIGQWVAFNANELE